MTRPSPADEWGGRILVRPPALVEASAGVRAAARAAESSATELATALAAVAAFGPVAPAFRGMGRVWAEELGRLVREAGELAASVELAATDYLRTDAGAAG